MVQVTPWKKVIRFYSKHQQKDEQLVLCDCAYEKQACGWKELECYVFFWFPVAFWGLYDFLVQGIFVNDFI